MIEKIVSGGQTGVDQSALRAARAAGIATGGWAPKGWLVEREDGKKSVPAPWLADFGLVECETPGYPAGSVANVVGSDATLWFGDWHTPGGRTTLDACRLSDKPYLIVFSGTRPSAVARWLEEKGIRILNVAGNRESVAPGIGAKVERFLLDVFARLGRGG